MHILVVPSSYPSEDAPLRSSFFKEQSIALKNFGHNVGVIYSETRNLKGVNISSLKKNHFQVEYCVESGINTIRLHGWNILMMRNFLGVNLWVKQSLKLFNLYIKKYGKPDVIHVHVGLYGGLVAKAIKDKYNIPYVITEHSSIVLNKLYNDYQKNIMVQSYNNADTLISVGNSLKKSMKELTNNDIKVVPNIVNTATFNFKGKEKKEKFTFISVCFLKKNKNVDSTIRVFSKVYGGNKKFELCIIGVGEEKNNLENLVKSLNVENQVKFVGAISRENLSMYLNKSDAFVLPSNFETFGVVYIEALACGLPIIVTKCGGPEDFFNENLGYMIDVKDEDGLEKAMIDIVSNIDNFDNEKISKEIKEKFSSEVIVDKLNSIYNDIDKN